MDKTNHHKGSPTINGKNDHNQPDTINKRKTKGKPNKHNKNKALPTRYNNQTTNPPDHQKGRHMTATKKKTDCAEYQIKQGISCKNCPTCHQEAYQLIEKLQATIQQQKQTITDHEKEIERLQDDLERLQDDLQYT